MGYVILSPLELVEKYVRSEAIQILPGEPGHKWGGFLYVEEVEITLKGSPYWEVQSLNWSESDLSLSRLNLTNA
jgi:hypothetical protein